MKSDNWIFDDSATTAIQMAKSVARDNAHGQFFPAHLIKELFIVMWGLESFLNQKTKILLILKSGLTYV